MLVHFSKYHGTGNDFVMIDGRELDKLSFQHQSDTEALCDRRFGIGGDGLIILDESGLPILPCATSMQMAGKVPCAETGDAASLPLPGIWV